MQVWRRLACSYGELACLSTEPSDTLSSYASENDVFVHAIKHIIAFAAGDLQKKGLELHVWSCVVPDWHTHGHLMTHFLNTCTAPTLNF